MNNNENNITNENENEEIELTDKDIKDNSNNRLNILFKFLWFFSAAFLFGVKFIDETKVNKPTEPIELLPTFIIGSSLFAIISIVIYVIKEMPIFSNSKIDNKTYKTAEDAYQTVINNIRMIIYGTAMFLIVPTILLKYMNIYIYDMEFIGAIAVILGILFIIRMLDMQKCSIKFETTDQIIPSTIWSTLINVFVYILCLTIAMNYQVLHILPTLQALPVV